MRQGVVARTSVGVLLALALAAALGLTGCVSKATAKAQAREAFIAGQQQAMQQMRERELQERSVQLQGPTVTVLGLVRNKIVPWAPGATLAKSLLAAQYYGPADPSEILIQREGQEIKISPSDLLNGKDIPIEPRDVIEIR